MLYLILMTVHAKQAHALERQDHCIQIVLEIAGETEEHLCCKPQNRLADVTVMVL